MLEEFEKDKRKKELIMENQNPDLENLTNDNKSMLGEEAQYIPLPSKGYFYKNQFRNMSQLKVRQLDWTDEDILTTESFYQNGSVFNELLSRVIVDDNKFSSKQLLPVDKDAILIWLRIAAFGTEYQIKRKCTNDKCKKVHTATWDLSQIEMPEFNPQYYAEIQEHGEVEIELPISKKRIKITIPSINKELEVQKQLEVKKEKSNSNQDYLITGKLLSSISAVYSEEEKAWKRDKTSIAQFLANGLKKIPDSRHILKVLKDITIKIEVKQDITCPHCKHFEEGVEMPMTIYFFWPEYEGIS